MTNPVARAIGERGDGPLAAAWALVARDERQAAQRAPRRSRHRELLVGELYRFVHAGVVVAVMLTVFLLDHRATIPQGLAPLLLVRLTVKNALILGLFIVAWQRAFALAGLSPPEAARRWSWEARQVVLACSAGSLVLLAFPALSNSGAFGFDDVALTWFGACGAMLLAHRALHVAERPRGGRARRHVLIVGSGPRALRTFHELARHDDEVEVVGFVDSDIALMHDEIVSRMQCTLEELEQLLMRRVVDEVIIALPVKSCYAQIQRVIEECERAGVESKYPVDVFQPTLARPRFEPSERFPSVALRVVSDDARVAVKRLIDVAGAAAGLVLLAPVLLAIAAAIKLTSPGPVLFAQERYGLRKRRFRMIKFRTMVPEAEALQALVEARNEAVGPVFKMRDDPRTTPIGRLLRRSSLDELPQLVNVLLGDMSLVGPRPLPLRDVQRFDRPWLMRRFSVPPGLTGLWQVSGRSDLTFDEWITLDLAYIDNWSLRLDLRILLRTIPAVFRGTGAS
jgi:exopolysaccharide biosynthesis polyprenyl glycosylphosphotransferase